MWIFLVLGVTMRNTRSMQAVWSLLMPLQFGVDLLSEADLPAWLQAFTGYNPLPSPADAARGLTVGGPISGTRRLGGVTTREARRRFVRVPYSSEESRCVEGRRLRQLFPCSVPYL